VLAADLPSYGYVVGTIAATGFIGGIGGYVAGALAEYFDPTRRPEELAERWSKKGVRWIGFAACVYWLYRWAGIT
jgi:hypothetical protein